MRLLTLSLILLYPAICAALDETSIREQLSEASLRYFEARQFLALNDMEEQLRVGKERTPSGLMKLPSFYSHAYAKTHARDSVGLAREWTGKFSIVDEWITATPDAQAPYLSKASMLINYAWNKRGYAYANKVPEKNMSEFKALVEEARQVLVDSSRITGNNPYWFSLMANIAKLQGWDETELLKLFRRGVEITPDYYRLYMVVADYYQPMWYGTPEKMRKFVDMAVKHAEDEDADMLYTRIYWSQAESLMTGNIFREWADWDRMSRGFEKLLVRYPDSAWNLNAYAYFACKGSYLKTADRLIARIGDDFVSGAWGSMKPRGLMKVCRDYAKEQIAAGNI